MECACKVDGNIVSEICDLHMLMIREASALAIRAAAGAAREARTEHQRLVRELDVALNGEDGAAQQASLCDIVAQVKGQRWKLVRAE